MTNRWFFIFFFLSGLCSLLYEVVWMRLAMAHFGVTTPLISIFLSLFMAGLGLGSWAFGRLSRRYESHSRFQPLRLYALAELLIGISAYVVPHEMDWARRILESSGDGFSLSNGHYYFFAGGLMLLILLPWCTCMGATFPLAMAAIRKLDPREEKSFSFLYLANVLGAIFGALLPAFVMVELVGFKSTLHITALLNFFIFLAAFALSLRPTATPAIQPEAQHVVSEPTSLSLPASTMLGVLFLTGLISMAMEVVWIRKFTPFLGTDIYAFALILAVYLAGTFLGSQAYRLRARIRTFNHVAWIWILLGLTALLPLLLADPSFKLRAYFRLALALLPFTALGGFLTPMLVDHFSLGDPDRAGRAYAVNVVGCILGPLLSGFWLLPHLGERWSLVALSAPLYLLIFWLRPEEPAGSFAVRALRFAETAALGVALILFTHDFEGIFPNSIVRRDYTATIIATGQGMNKMLIMNGQNLTVLTPATKMMAHFPLALLDHPPRNSLVVCFGMGTTHRSMLSWGISSTAVELLPAVPSVYGYFHADGPQLLQLPNSHLVIDDGRMFLEKTREQYDVITIDPPPPIYAAGVSLLYSQEFYEVAKKRLAPGGILQQWFFSGDATDVAAVTKAVQQAFPYIRAYQSVAGYGVHYIASMSPLPDKSPAQLAQAMPPAAIADMLEWGPGKTAEQQFAILLSHQYDLRRLAAADPLAGPLHDDNPENEYRYLRAYLKPETRLRLFGAIAKLHN